MHLAAPQEPEPVDGYRVVIETAVAQLKNPSSTSTGSVRHSAEGRRRYVPWFWLGIASFTVAYATWLTGTADHELCRPDLLIPTHAIRYLLTAFATWSFFMYFRTERPVRVTVEDNLSMVTHILIF